MSIEYNDPVFIPVVDPLTEIESKSPRMRKQYAQIVEHQNECRTFNQQRSKPPTLLRPVFSLLSAIDRDRKDREDFMLSAYNGFIEQRGQFHETLDRHSDCYHRVLEYDQKILRDPGLAACGEKLDRLWDMFAYGDEYFKNQFMSYFGAYMKELDEAILATSVSVSD